MQPSWTMRGSAPALTKVYGWRQKQKAAASFHRNKENLDKGRPKTNNQPPSFQRKVKIFTQIKNV